MGFMKDLKEGTQDIVDQVTGHFGEMTLDVSSTEIHPGYNMGYKILIIATDKIKAKSVVLRLNGTAEYEENIEIAEGEAEYSRMKTKAKCTIEKEYEICGEFEMAEGERKAISGKIIIPNSCRTISDESSSRSEWELEAVVEIPWAEDITKKTKLYFK